MESIKASADYYWGVGSSLNSQEARDMALEDLTQKISVKVQASFKQKLNESGDALEEQVEKVLQTYSQATLKNVQFHSTMLKGKIQVFAYIHKEEVTKIFDERKQLIYELYLNATNQINQNLNVAQALKLCYFAHILLQSVPDVLISVKQVNLTTTIPQTINDLSRNVRFVLAQDEKISDSERRVTLDVTYMDKAVSLIDFVFWDGSNQVNVQGRDGQAVFSLYGASTSFTNLDAVIKYNYYESRKEIAAVCELWDAVIHPEFDTNTKILLSKNIVQKVKASVTPQKAAGVKLIIPDRFADATLPFEQVAAAVKSFQDAVNAKGSNLATLFKDDPFLYRKMNDFMRYNHPTLLDQYVEAATRPTWHGCEVRRIPVQQNYPTLNKQTTEYIVLDTDSSGAFSDFSTALNNNTYLQFVENDSFIDEYRQRQTILKFVEKYRTAYMARDMTMISQMFAEEALIIVGRTLKEKPHIPDMPQYEKIGDQPDVEYLTFSKKEYLERQATIFKGQSDILVEFSTFKIMKKQGADNVFGVEMRQNYYSTAYSDEGYLFLLIDFNHKDPLIYVRAWQPQEWRPEQLISASNYKIH